MNSKNLIKIQKKNQDCKSAIEHTQDILDCLMEKNVYVLWIAGREKIDLYVIYTNGFVDFCNEFQWLSDFDPEDHDNPWTVIVPFGNVVVQCLMSNEEMEEFEREVKDAATD